MIRPGKRLVKRALAPVVRALRGGARELSPALWGLDVTPGGRLSFGGVELAALRAAWGSPLHVVLGERLTRNAGEFLAINAGTDVPRAEVFFSYKTNPVPGVLRVLHAAGLGAEVISAYELWLALELGVPPERIVYNGPAKSAESIRLAIQRDVLLLNLNHREEIGEVARHARASGRRPRVGVRVTTAGGWSGQFGSSVSSGEAFAAFREAHATGALDVCAIHSHVGGMLRTAEQVRAAVSEVLALSDRLRAELGLRISFLDLGGSLATPTVAGISQLDRRMNQTFQADLVPPAPEATLPIREYVRGAVEQVEGHFRALGEPPPRILFEPGRAVTGNAQVLLASVLSLKADGAAPTWAILDAGINLAECVRNEFHQVFPAARMDAPRSHRYRLAGPICSPADVLRWSISLPALEPGDALAIMDAGAYFVPFATSFSFPQPAIVLAQGGAVRLLRRAERFEDQVALDGPAPDAARPSARAQQRSLEEGRSA